MHEMVHWGGDCILCTCKLCDHVTTVCAVCYIHVYIEMFIVNTESCYCFFYNWQYTVSITILCVYVSVYVWHSIQSFVVMWVVYFLNIVIVFFLFFCSVFTNKKAAIRYMHLNGTAGSHSCSWIMASKSVNTFTWVQIWTLYL